jgi:CheY-like chemotaxis protein
MPTSSKAAKILIIDDDSKDLQFLGKILQEQNYEIFLASDGEEGLKRAEKVNPDMILLDLVLPGLDGFEVLSRLKKSLTTQKIPVIIITGKTSTEDFEKCFSLGAADLLHKPFSSSELLTRIFTQISVFKTGQELENKISESKQLLQIVGHDLSNQLFGVSEILEIYKADKDELIKNIPMVEESIKNAQSIIEIIKQFIFLEGKGREWDLTSVPLKSSIESVVKGLTIKYQKKNINVDLSKVPENLFVLVHQQSFIQSVLPNLLSNSFKFSLKDSKVEISAKEENGSVILEIRDIGIGMSKDILDGVFSLTEGHKYKRGTEGEIGMGYGLSLVKKFIDTYGGEIKIETSEGKGTTVKLRLQKGSSKEISF